MIVFALSENCTECGATRTYRIDDMGREETKLETCPRKASCDADLCRVGRLEAARLKPQAPA